MFNHDIMCNMSLVFAYTPLSAIIIIAVVIVSVQLLLSQCYYREQTEMQISTAILGFSCQPNNNASAHILTY